jgi:hypothetical protein
MSAPAEAFYYDPVYGACEPCFSPTLKGNQCVYSAAADPRNQDWIIDDDDVYPDQEYPTLSCKEGEVFDKVLGKCRAMCPGEGAGGQQYEYDDSNSGSCNCFDPAHFVLDPASNQCVPVEAPPQLRAMMARRLRVQPGDDFSMCDPSTGQYTNCYFPNSDVCMDATGDQSMLSMALTAQARHTACPFLLCNTKQGHVTNGQFTAPRADCVCLTQALGQRIHKGGKAKKMKLKK